MVFNSTFNNISVMSWWPLLLVEETREKHRPGESYWQTLSHHVSRTPRHEWGSNLHCTTLVIAQVVVNPTTIHV